MRYQIIRTGGKFVIRKGRGLFSSYIRDLQDNMVEFTSEAAALELLIERSKSNNSYAGAVVREVWFEDYHYD